MARDLFEIEKGLHLTGENSDVGVQLLFGSGAPAMDAEVGSIYARTDDGTLWRKIAAGVGSGNWEKVPVAADITTIKFRGESVVALTSTIAPVSGGTIDLVATPLAGDEGSLLVGADFIANVSHILFGFGGTEKLMKVSVVVGDVITLVDASPVLSAGDSFVVQHYLPNSGGTLENQALVYFDGSTYIKLADVNFAFANGINLTAGYTAGAGNVVPGDTVEAAIQKLDGVNDAQDLSFGLSQGAVNFGTFVSTLISANQNAKQIFEELGAYLQTLWTNTKNNIPGITTITTLDEVTTQNFQLARWLVVAKLDSDLARTMSFEVVGLHNGTEADGDATLVDDTVYGKLKLGTPFNIQLSVDLNGVGAAQTMRLRAQASASVTVSITRMEVNVVA